MTIVEAIARAADGGDLGEEGMRAVMDRLLAGAATPAQIAALLIALRMKGETVDELVGAARAMRAHMTPVPTTRPVVDTCGTGGDGQGTFNVSTAAALIAAGAGAVVAKHGNRGMSGRVGGADVLEALGVVIDLPAEGVAHCLERAGVAFCFAQRFHGAMRAAAGPRREIGVRTMLNLLGPLASPAGAATQLVGVFAPAWTEPLAAALARLGTRRALVVHGGDGMDEISARTLTRVSEVADGAVRTYTRPPEDFGVAPDGPPLGRVASAAESAGVIRDVLAGAPGAARDVALVNAAAVLVVAGIAPDWKSGAAAAAASIDGGAAARALDRLVAASRAAAGVV